MTEEKLISSPGRCGAGPPRPPGPLSSPWPAMPTWVKSAIFNQLTGLEQETGNWSGKTVALKEGKLAHHGLDIQIVDLPGVYSFSSYSPDELLTRQFILNNRPDVIINVLDATSMERNLYLTLLLKELDVPLRDCLKLCRCGPQKAPSPGLA